MMDAAAILNYDFGLAVQSYEERDAILYALGVGLGGHSADLQFLDERSIAVLPSFAVTLCSPGMWIRDPSLNVDFAKLVHFAQAAEFFEPLPPRGAVHGKARVLSLVDRGAERGALLVIEREICDAGNSRIYCRLQQTLLLRGDGGFGGSPAARAEKFAPGISPNFRVTFATSKRAALIYRLSGDLNPLHFDPAFAQQAGFPRPILHGLASYALAGLVVSRALGKDPAQVRSLACNFSGVVFPGEELTFEIWSEDTTESHFRALVGDRLVLDRGMVSWGSRNTLAPIPSAYSAPKELQ